MTRADDRDAQVTQNDLETTDPAQVPPATTTPRRTRTSRSLTPLCRRCEEPLHGRQTLWCSDECRVSTARDAAAAERDERQRRIVNAMTMIANGLAVLKEELSRMMSDTGDRREPQPQGNDQ